MFPRSTTLESMLQAELRSCSVTHGCLLPGRGRVRGRVLDAVGEHAQQFTPCVGYKGFVYEVQEQDD
eukprot:767614-Hanusia_phi.AAC.3